MPLGLLVARVIQYITAFYRQRLEQLGEGAVVSRLAANLYVNCFHRHRLAEIDFVTRFPACFLLLETLGKLRLVVAERADRSADLFVGSREQAPHAPFRRRAHLLRQRQIGADVLADFLLHAVHLYFYLRLGRFPDHRFLDFGDIAAGAQSTQRERRGETRGSRLKISPSIHWA